MLEKFERYPLTFGPTHIEKLERLTAHLGGGVELWAKREDCNSGLAYGGNKLRKLEYIIQDAIAATADTLVSIGGVQSNHTRMVAAVAAKIGMKCRLVQESWVPHEDAVYDRVGNIMLSRIMGADVQLVDDGFDIGIRESWQKAIEDVRAKGGKPYPIPAGASVHKYGGLGYVGADQGAGARNRPQHGRPRRARPRAVSGRRRPHRGLRLPLLWRALRRNQAGDPPLRTHGGDDHRPRLRGQIHAGHDRPRAEGLLPHRRQGALRASRRRSRPQRLR